MNIAIDPGSTEPPYEQVRRQIEEAIDRGEVQTDQRLPPVRQLAGDIGLATNTVARAYRELEASGRLETRGRHGTFVAGQPTAARRHAEETTRTYVEQMRELGLGPLEIVATLRRELEGPDI